MWTRHSLPHATCPACGHHYPHAVGPGGAPTPGCLMVCGSCARILTFTETLGLREVSGEEFENLHPTARENLRQNQDSIRRRRAARQN